jgi:hypothetical protein
LLLRNYIPTKTGRRVSSSCRLMTVPCLTAKSAHPPDFSIQPARGTLPFLSFPSYVTCNVSLSEFLSKRLVDISQSPIYTWYIYQESIYPSLNELKYTLCHAIHPKKYHELRSLDPDRSDILIQGG